MRLLRWPTIPLLLLLLLPWLRTSPACSDRVALLIDPAVVAEVSDGASIQLGPVAKSAHNPLLQEDQLWEAAWWNTNPSVFHHNGSYHMYYTSNIVCEAGRRAGMCPHSGWEGPVETTGPHTGLLYAHSPDGVKWQKPSLGLFSAPPNHSKANNIVLANAALGNGVFYDTNAGLFRQFGHSVCEAASEMETAHARHGGTLAVSSSADGISNWTQCTSAATMDCEGDTTNNALWDADAKRYFAFTRIDNGGASAKTLGTRREARSVSADFRTWSKAEEVLHGEAGYEAYAAVPFKPPVGARPGFYLGLGMFYNITAGGSTAWSTSADRGKVYCELLRSTTYGANWTRLAPGQPFIPHGGAGSLDSHTTYAAARPFESPDAPGTMLFYYAGGNGPHSGPRRNFMMLATAPTSALAGYVGPGVVLTHAVQACEGGRWLVHHTAGGSVRVAVTSSTRTAGGGGPGQVLLGADASSLVFEKALGDGVQVSRVVWAGSGVRDYAHLAPTGVVSLRFELARGSTLYAFQCLCNGATA